MKNGVPVMLEDRLANMQVVPDYLQQDFTRIRRTPISPQLPIVEGEHRAIEAVNVTRAEVVFTPKLMNIRLVAGQSSDVGPAVRRRKSSPKCARSILVRGYRLEGACANDPSAPAGLYTEMPEKRLGVTREVARYPEGEYDWRISLGDSFCQSVRSPHFRLPAQYQRAGRRRDVPDNRWARSGISIAPFRALGFNGASGVSCEIVGCPLLDFNVIYWRLAGDGWVAWAGNVGRIRVDYGYCLMPGLRWVRVGDQRYLLEHTTACWWMKRWRWLSRTLRARVWPASR